MKMKRLLSLALALLLVLSCMPVSARAAEGIAIDETNFPDENFRNYLLDSYYGTDGVVTQEELKRIDSIYVRGMGIRDLTGIALFTELERLDCSLNPLNGLDVSKNTKLKVLHCLNAGLTSLDVSQNAALEELLCQLNPLTTLDVSRNAALKSLMCFDNMLTSLDVSHNKDLVYLFCESNELAELDVSNNTALKSLTCSCNQLTSLDVSKNTVLEDLNCHTNQLTSLDVSQNTALVTLYCVTNQLTSLDVSRNTEMLYLSCAENQLTALDVSNNTALDYLYCSSNQLTALDVSNNTALTHLSCDYNQLTSLDVSRNTVLQWLDCYNNQLTSLDVSNNLELEALDCSHNQLTSLDVSKNAKLEFLYCNNNQLTSLDISQNTEIWHPDNLCCYENELTIELDANNQFDLTTLPGFDVTKASNWEGGTVNGTVLTVNSGCEAVTYTYQMGPGWSETFTLIPEDTTDVIPADGIPVDEAHFPDDNFRAWILEQDYGEDGVLAQEELASVKGIYVNWESIEDMTGIEYFTALEELYCIENRLTSLDVTRNTALRILSCSENQLTSLDVSKNTELERLYCDNNQLTSLDVSKNTALVELWCYYNQLTSLDVSKNTALTELHCSSNQLTSLDVSKNTALESLLCSSNKLSVLDVTQNTALKNLGCSSNYLTSLDVSKNTLLSLLWADGNACAIKLDKENSFDLSILPGRFDVSKTSNWVGGTVSGSTLKVDGGCEAVTYTYQMGNYWSETFTLKIETATTDIIRLAGANRYETATLVADQMKETLGIEQFDAVILANGYNFADALAGSYLSARKQAPILLTWNGADKYAYLNDATIDYVKENLAPGGTVYILGGTAAVPASIDAALADFNIRRMDGANRFETNIMILEEAGIPEGSEVLVCTSTNFADSLSASAAGKPILLVWNERGILYGDQPQFLEGLKAKGCTFTVIGGESAVSAKMMGIIEGYGEATRLAGANRFETSVLVAEKYFPDATSAVLAYAWDFPDGLCGGGLANAMGAPLILTMTKYESQAADYIQSQGITTGMVLGGEKLISEDSIQKIFGN